MGRRAVLAGSRATIRKADSTVGKCSQLLVQIPSSKPEFGHFFRMEKNALWNTLVVRTTSAGGPMEQIDQC